MKHFILSMLTLLFVVTCAQKKEYETKLEYASINLLESNPNDGVILDVRRPEEFREGHVPNAQNLNFFSSNLPQQLEKLDRNAKYYVYCAGGVRSGKMVNEMQKLGFVDIVDLNDGFSNWEGDVQLESL